MKRANWILIASVVSLGLGVLIAACQPQPTANAQANKLDEAKLAEAIGKKMNDIIDKNWVIRPRGCVNNLIHQGCVGNGCFTGDTAGFPVTITKPGKYSLCSNITVPDEKTTAIEIRSDNVSLDLNGFVISGPTTCTVVESEISCTPAGQGIGIHADKPTNTEVKNGTVRGMGNVGVWVNSGSRITDVRAMSNGSAGIKADGDGVLIAKNAVMLNGAEGILAWKNTIIKENIVSQNKNTGISTQENCLVTENMASHNGDNGIVSGCVATITNNVTIGNKTNGIDTCGAATVTGNSSKENGVDSLKIGSGSCDANTLETLNGDCQPIKTNYCINSNAQCP